MTKQEDIMKAEFCPNCYTRLEHLLIKKEDVFGCPKCKKEITYKDSKKSRGQKKITCDNCKKCGEITCGNDTEFLRCFEPR